MSAKRWAYCPLRVQFIHTFTWITVTLLIYWKPFLLPHLLEVMCFSWQISYFLPVKSEVQNPMLIIFEDAAKQFLFSLLHIAPFNLIPQWNSWTSTIIYISQHSSTTNYVIHFTDKHNFYNKTINLYSTTFGHRTTLSSCSQPLTFDLKLLCECPSQNRSGERRISKHLFITLIKLLLQQAFLISQKCSIHKWLSNMGNV